MSAKQPWINAGLCRDAKVGPDGWEMFPEDTLRPNSPAYKEEVRRLRSEFCWRCPVRTACFRYAMSDPDARDNGVWGGTTPDDRNKVFALDCRCGSPLDPRDIVTRLAITCPNCRPLRKALDVTVAP